MTAPLASTALPSVPLVVVDCPAEAWAASRQDARDELGDFYSEHDADLDNAAADLIAEHLTAAWRKRDRLLRLVPACVARPQVDEEPIPDGMRWLVWQEAADLVSADLLLFAAGLDGVFAEYRAGLPADEPDRDHDLAGDR